MYHNHLFSCCPAQAVPTILPSGTMWDFKHARLHVGAESLQLQGTQYSSSCMPSMNQCQDLAGNAFLGEFCFEVWYYKCGAFWKSVLRTLAISNLIICTNF